MNIGVIVAIAIVIISVVVNNNSSPEPESSPSPEPVVSSSPSPSPDLSSDPSPTPKPTPTPSPTSTPSSTTSLEIFHYPASDVENQSENSLTLKTFHSAKEVTDWYQNTIKGLGYSTTAFVRTSTNDNVNNELAAQGFGQNIRVVIRQENPTATTTITVTKE